MPSIAMFTSAHLADADRGTDPLITVLATIFWKHIGVPDSTLLADTDACPGCDPGGFLYPNGNRVLDCPVITAIAAIWATDPRYPALLAADS